MSKNRFRDIILCGTFIGGLILGAFDGESIDIMAEYIVMSIVSVMSIPISLIVINQMNKSEKDYYSLEEEKIKKYIKEKIEYYDNNYSKYFL